MKKVCSIILVLSFSYTGYAQLDSTSIPVRLSYFEAGTNGTTATLNWKTVCYLDYANFEIQKSTDGNTYQPINSFLADRLRCQQPFDFTDNIAGAATRIFYRITVKDIDGRAYQSKIVSVYTKGNGFSINSFAPTIVNTAVNISLSSATNDNIQFAVINMQGTIVIQKTMAISKGASTHQVSLDGLQKGKYTAVFETQKGEKNTISFIKL